MTKQVEAVYENGVLRPLEPLPLREHQLVTVLITGGTTVPQRSHLDLQFLERIKREVEAAEPIPTHEEIRRMTSTDPDSWAALIVSEREDRC